MDWDLKMPPWDLAELDRAAEQNIGAIVAGPSGGGGGAALRCPAIGLECSVDLKLGGVADSGSSYKWKEQPRLSSTTAVSSSGLAKRHRGPGNVSQNAPCSVDGCKADLSKCREYHRRHKVCEVHSKTPVVSVGGQEQRFCQQCSRFHLLLEFDDVKRSCRKRLDGHNRRRRKPQPNSINSGTRFLSYPQVFPTAAMEPNWSRIVKAEEGIGFAPCTAPDLAFFPNSSSRGFCRERKQFPFAPESESSSIISSVTMSPHLLTSTVPGVVVGGGGKMLSDEPTFRSDCALSLLSSPTAQTPGTALSHRIPIAQPLVPTSLHYAAGDLEQQYSHLAAAARTVSATGYSCSVVGGDGPASAAVLVAGDADVHCQGMFHIGGGETSQGLPFSWQ